MGLAEGIAGEASQPQHATGTSSPQTDSRDGLPCEWRMVVCHVQTLQQADSQLLFGVRTGWREASAGSSYMPAAGYAPWVNRPHQASKSPRRASPRRRGKGKKQRDCQGRRRQDSDGGSPRGSRCIQPAQTSCHGDADAHPGTINDRSRLPPLIKA